eukprot:6487594-Amphidinium_carterae.3
MMSISASKLSLMGYRSIWKARNSSARRRIASLRSVTSGRGAMSLAAIWRSFNTVASKVA